MDDLDDSDIITDEEAARWQAEDEVAARARLPVGTRVRWPEYPNLGVCVVKHSHLYLAFICPEDRTGCPEPVAVPHTDLEQVV